MNKIIQIPLYCKTTNVVFVYFLGTVFVVHSTYANILKNIYKKIKKIVGIG
jgi:hypothetical protein